MPRRRQLKPARTPAGFDRREIESFQRVAILGARQFRNRKEVFSDVQTFLTAMRAVEEVVAGIETELAEVLGKLFEVVEVNHTSYISSAMNSFTTSAGMRSSRC